MKKLITMLLLSAVAANPAYADKDRTYRVTIINASVSHILTPAFIASHNDNYRLFQLGTEASHSLAVQAETGDPSLVANDASASGNTSSITTGGLIPPASSESFIITANNNEKLTYSAMLAGSNDAFVALNGVALPKKMATYSAYVYDAGSEQNNEDCNFIPGPPCNNGSNNRTATNEGFVTIHNGVHGIADLVPADSDWRGPVAIVKIERIKE